MRGYAQFRSSEKSVGKNSWSKAHSGFGATFANDTLGLTLPVGQRFGCKRIRPKRPFGLLVKRRVYQQSAAKVLILLSNFNHNPEFASHRKTNSSPLSARSNTAR